MKYFEAVKDTFDYRKLSNHFGYYYFSPLNTEGVQASTWDEVEETWSFALKFTIDTTLNYVDKPTINVSMTYTEADGTVYQTRNMTVQAVPTKNPPVISNVLVY